MISALNDRLEAVLKPVLAMLFTGLIGVVFLQVFARNVLKAPMIWTLDMAQLLFAWCIFLGAALAFRYGTHYHVDLWAKDSRFGFVPAIASTLGSAAVIGVLVWHGAVMSMIGLHREPVSLNISEFWFYLPIPLGAAFMASFLIERIIRSVAR